MDTQILEFVDFSRIPYALAVIAVAWVSNRFITRTLDDLGVRFTERRLLFKQITSFTRFVILIGAAALVAASVVRFSSEVLLAIGGSVAVAVGFAFKDLLASLMAGLILLLDRPFQVGDRVEFGGHYGEVLEIGLRTVRINTLDDNLISVPNSRFLTDAVSCANAGALEQMCVFEFWIGMDQDFDVAKEIAYDATASSNFVYLKRAIIVHLKEVTLPHQPLMAMKVTVKAYVFDGRFESAFGTDVHERVHRAFRAAGIASAAA
ncbi:MAG: mechanosensitive ion channel [Alphaproteobacteria bacterium]|nr:mechanosensitive ion channel [Alphaproteobacteria bacterium]